MVDSTDRIEDKCSISQEVKMMVKAHDLARMKATHRLRINMEFEIISSQDTKAWKLARRKSWHRAQLTYPTVAFYVHPGWTRQMSNRLNLQ